LGQMKEDLRSAIDFAEREFLASSIALVSSSLGVRAALKEASEDERVKLLISLIGVFNLQGTLYAIYREDGVDEVLNGIPLGVRDIMGFQIDADHFLNAAIRGNFHTLQTSLQDATNLSIPTVFFAAEKDPWVSIDEVRLVFDQISIHRKEIYVIPNTMHELYENPASTDYACRKVVTCAEKYLAGRESKWETIRIPERGLLIGRLREEKDRLRSGKGLNPEEEKNFWKRYLEKYAYIVNLQDYWNLLDFLNQLLGNWRRGEKILDAGCGIGNFGTFVIVRQLYHLMQGKAISFQTLPFAKYVGVDFLDEAIQQAATTHTEIQKELKGKMGLESKSPNPVNCYYSVLDLNRPLPFRNHCFDKVCCNFVLSYLSDPSYPLKELFRTLRIGGRIVVTSIKPYADLSQIYRDFIQVSRSPEELEQARLVLNNVAMIKHKEAEGYYQFFSEDELYNLLIEVGANNIQTFRSFGDQANVAVADKSDP
ncbi:MAG: methyltransferase domain-containing protein, partial [Candidatus Hydrothermarchaeales archaeon]